MISSDFLKKLPWNSSAYIYGAGTTGKKLLHTVSSKRPDIRISGFLDTFKSGDFLGFSLTKISDFKDLASNFDFILVASTDIESIGKMKSNLQQWSEKVIVPFEEKSEVFDPLEIKKLEQIRSKLEFGKNVFDLVIDARKSKNFDLVNNYYNENCEKMRQYFSGAPITDGQVILDGGTFDGREAMRFARATGKTGKVYSFDPWGGSHVKEWSTINDLGNIEIVKRALWNKTKKVFFSSNVSESGAAGAYVSDFQDGGFEELDAISIDDFVSDYKLDRIDFIKMDIEGSELHALEGAKETIKKFKPNMSICVYHDSAHFYQIPEYVLSIYPEYKLGFGHYSTHADESVIYFLK